MNSVFVRTLSSTSSTNNLLLQLVALPLEASEGQRVRQKEKYLFQKIIQKIGLLAPSARLDRKSSTQL